MSLHRGISFQFVRHLVSCVFLGIALFNCSCHDTSPSNANEGDLDVDIIEEHELDLMEDAIDTAEMEDAFDYDTDEMEGIEEDGDWIDDSFEIEKDEMLDMETDEVDGDCTDPVCCINGVPANQGESCSDNDPTTGRDVCVNGECKGARCGCRNMNDCCDGCFPTHEGEACDDGNLLTMNDTCNAGICLGLANNCNVVSDGEFCDDGNIDTIRDICLSGECTGYDPKLFIDCRTSEDCSAEAYCMRHEQHAYGMCERMISLGLDGELSRTKFSCDGTFFAATVGKMIRIWERRHYRVIRILGRHDGKVKDFLFLHDDRLLAAVDDAGYVTVWDLKSGHRIAKELISEEGLTALAYHALLNSLFISGKDHLIYIIPVQSTGVLSSPARTWSGHLDDVTDIAVSPDGSTIATSGRDGKVLLWNSGTESIIYELRSVYFESWYESVTFSEDGTFLAASNTNGFIALWDVATGEDTGSFWTDLTRHFELIFASDDEWIVSGTGRGRVVVWDRESGSEAFRLEKHNWDIEVSGISISPDGNFIAEAADDRQLRIWNLGEATVAYDLSGHRQKVRTVRYAPDDRSVACLDNEGTIRFYDSRTGVFRSEIQGHGMSLGSGIRYSHDGQTIVTTGGWHLNEDWDSWAIKLWNVSDGTWIRSLYAPLLVVDEVAFSPDGKWLAAIGCSEVNDFTCIESKILLYEMDTMNEGIAYWAHNGWGNTVQFSPDGGMLVSGGSRGLVKLWQVDGSELTLIRELPAEGELEIKSARIDPYGRYIVAGGTMAEAVYLWDLASGQETGRFTGHTRDISELAFFPNSSLFASSSWDFSIRIMNAETLVTEAILMDSTVQWGVDIATDQKSLVTGEESYSARIWRLDPLTINHPSIK